MKKIFLILGLVATSFLVACGPTTDDAIEHNDSIVADQVKVLDANSDFVDIILDEGSKQKDIENAYDEYLEMLNNTLKKYEDMEPFDEKDTFRKAMIDLLTELVNVTTKEYRELIDIFKKEESSITDADVKRVDELADSIEEKEEKATNKFLDAQKAFAGEYNFELVEN